MVDLRNTAPKKKTVPARNVESPSKAKSKPVRENKMLERMLLLALLLLTAFVFSSTLKNDFIDTWDDGVYVTDNVMITKLDKESLVSFFTTPLNGTYVPLPLLSFAIDYKLFKLEAWGYHLHNLLLHLVCTLLVFFLLKKLKIKPVYAFFGALLFGIHPMRVESVAWVTERKDLLFSMYYLGAVLSYLFYVTEEKNRRRYYLLTLVFFIVSLFSKIQAVSLPLTLLVIDYYVGRPLKFKLLLEKVPHFLLSLGFGIAGIFILRNVGSLEVNEAFSLTERIFFGLHSMLLYLMKVIFPYPQSIYYPYPANPGEALPVMYYLAPVILIGLAVLVFLTRKKNKAIVFGSLFFVVNIMFLLQILSAGQAFQADRFTYIPYLGFFFLAAWGAQYFVERNKSFSVPVFTAIPVILVIFMIMTHQRCLAWKNSETIWTDVIEQFPEKIANAYANRASYYRKTNQWPKSIDDYTVAMRLDKKNPVSIMNRGNLYFDMGKDSEAYVDYMAALKMKKKTMDLQRLYANIGAIYGRKKMYDSAMVYLNKSVEEDPKFAVAYLNRALTYEERDMNQQAIQDYLKYIELKPEDDRVYSSIGVNYMRKGDFVNSLKWLNDAIRMNSREGVYYSNRAIAYFNLNDKAKALEDAQMANQLGYRINSDFMQKLTQK